MAGKMKNNIRTSPSDGPRKGPPAALAAQMILKDVAEQEAPDE